MTRGARAAELDVLEASEEEGEVVHRDEDLRGLVPLEAVEPRVGAGVPADLEPGEAEGGPEGLGGGMGLELGLRGDVGVGLEAGGHDPVGELDEAGEAGQFQDAAVDGEAGVARPEDGEARILGGEAGAVHSTP